MGAVQSGSRPDPGHAIAQCSLGNGYDLPAPTPSSSELGFSEHNLADGRIDIHRNHEVISAGEPRVSFPIRVDPLHDRLVDIVVSGPTGDADAVDSAISNGEIHIDTERLKAAALLSAEQFPLERGKLGHGRPGEFGVTG